MYHTIVIGLGSMGSAALYQLAKRELKVLGLEQFDIVHDQGSHSGQTRIVRKAYFEHPDYVPLLEESYRGWKELEELREEQYFYQNGLVYFGEADHPVMEGVKASAARYDIPLESIKNDQLRMFQCPEGFEGLLEPEAGFALVEPTIQVYVEEAEELGAEVQTGETVLGWRIHDDYIEVHTNKREYQTQKLILSSGAYMQRLLPRLSEQLKVTRQLIHWVKPPTPELFDKDHFNSWVIADKEIPGILYGFPILDPHTYGGNGLLKFAHHTPGTVIEPLEFMNYDPKEEQEQIHKLIAKYIPDALGEIVETTCCMYTNTTDEHFIVDLLPDTDGRIVLAAGFSGHGFKFVPVMGEILADLALEGGTRHPIGFLGLDRFTKG